MKIADVERLADLWPSLNRPLPTMYTKVEASQLRQAFWTIFGQYMAPVPSAEGLPINWINYKTGIRHVHFRLHADAQRATIAIELTHPDEAVRELFYEQLQALKRVLEDAIGEVWRWEANAQDPERQDFSRIYQELRPVNLFNRDDWPALISFFKPRLIGLDEFWSNAQYGFEGLQ